MTEGNLKTFFSSDLEQEILEEILQRIDENLALRPLLQPPPPSEAEGEVTSPPNLPDISPAPFRLRQMREWNAPLFLVKGRDLLNQFKRLLNLPIRIFGHKQLRFNRDLLDVLDILTARLQALDAQVAYQTQVGQVASQTLADLRKLAQGVQELAMRHQELREKLEQVSGAQRQFSNALHSFEAQVARLSEAQADHDRRFGRFAQDISNLAEAGQTLSQQFTQTNNAHDEQRQATNRELSQLAVAWQRQEQTLAEAGVEQRRLQDGLTDLAKAHSEIKIDHQSLQSSLAGLVNSQSGFAQQLEQARSGAQEVDGRLTQVTADSQGNARWLEQVAHTQRGQHEWIELIQRKLELLMLDLRENKGAGVEADGRLSEPRIVDCEAYQRLLAGMGDQIKVNVGCGEKTWPGYVNVDLRELRDVDVIADVRRLPFDPASLTELASAHLIEHFREHQFRTRLLPYWRSLLKPGGVLRVICPNWAAMLARLADGRMPLADFKRLTFGAQDYAGNDHFAMYTPETLRLLLLDNGFVRVEIQAEDRMNGICPEMEVWAWV